MATTTPAPATDRSPRGVRPGPRVSVSRGLVTITIATAALFVASAVFASTSVSRGAITSMLPFAAVLAVAAIGQTLVIQQGGIDLSVPGAISLVVVIVTHEPKGDDGKLLGAVLLALGVAVAAGLLNGFLVGRLLLNPIVATLGTNALMFAGVLGISGGSPRRTTDRLAAIAGGDTAGIPNAVFIAVVVLLVTSVIVKLTPAGRRFEAVGANPAAAWAAGLRVRTFKGAGYLGAQLHYWVAGVVLAGILAQPTAFQGNAYLLPSVAAVVLGGTSLLGGRGNLLATAVAALFLSQLEQFVLALGVSFAVRTLVEAAALAIGVLLYSVDVRSLVGRLRGRRRVPAAT
jgi:ribose transport system permease protein